MFHLNRIPVYQFVFSCVLLLVIVLPTVCPVDAQTTTDRFVTVTPTTEPLFYTPVGSNWTICFEAQWSTGDISGRLVGNATVTVQVNSTKNDPITLELESTTGLFLFNYSSITSDVLKFTPIKLVTPDGNEWSSSLEPEDNVQSLESESVVGWWDTFDASLVSYDTTASGTTVMSINVTYLLVPDEGLALPSVATYSGQTFLSKTVQNATVKINGEQVEETLNKGVFASQVSTWLPTAYMHVEVAQDGWVTVNFGFSFAHTANQPSWSIAVILCLSITLGALAVFFVRNRKSGNKFLSIPNYPVFGGVLILLTSVVSLYWGLVGLDSTPYGFDWALLTLFGLFSFVFGLTSGILSIMKKMQPLVIFLVCFPMVTNVVAVISSYDLYELAIPWFLVLGSFVLSVVGALLVCNADEEFT
ncbi:MAG: hypothetical protein WC325_04480 [Candidatus Bathyarchaeia archaeon]|jgi:hypothetical protein